MIENLKDGTKLPSGMMESHCFGKIWDACDFGRRVLSPLVSLFPHLTSSLCGTLFPCLIAMEDDTSVIQQNRNYILATCTALGGYEEKETAPGVIKQVYTLGDQALGNGSMVPFRPDELTSCPYSGCLRDLKRAIRAESNAPYKTFLPALADFNTLENDFIPIIKMHARDPSEIAERLILACCKS